MDPAAAPALLAATFLAGSVLAQSRGTRQVSRPVAFVEHQGQPDPSVRFITGRAEVSAFFTEDSFLLGISPVPPGLSGGRVSAAAHGLFFRFEGVSPEVRLQAVDRAPGLEHRFGGRAPGLWRPDLSRYLALRYVGLYPGIDLLVHGAPGLFLEYDLLVEPGADLSRVVVRCEGADGMSVDDSGALALRTSPGEIRQLSPRAFRQDTSGEARSVDCRFRSIDSLRFGFETPRAVIGERLTIDPGLVYSTYLGGSGTDAGDAVAVDNTGTAYVTGAGTSTFPVTPGALDTTPFISQGYVTKLAPDGSHLIYSTYIGGAWGHAITVDEESCAYFAGHKFSSPSEQFPTTPGSYNPNGVNIGDVTAVIAKLAPSGASLVYSSYIGGKSSANGMALDSSGQVFLCGGSDGGGLWPAFPTTPGAFQTPPAPYGGVFVTKLNGAGSELIYSSLFGGPVGLENSYAVAIDGEGAAYVAGLTFTESGFPVTSGAFQTTYGGGASGDAFVSTLDPTGSTLVYSTYLGGSGALFNDERAQAIAVDSTGAAYVAGRASSAPDFPLTPGAFDTVFSAGEQGFVAKLDPWGSHLIYSTLLSIEARAIALEPDGSAIVGGVATSWVGFETTPGAFAESYGGGTVDGFVTKLNSLGTGILYSTFLGGAGDSSEGVNGLARGTDGAAYATGHTSSPNFPVTSGAFDTTNFGGDRDVFVSKLTLAYDGPGLASFGTGTPGCSGPHALAAHSMPQVGNPHFAVTCSAAPPSSLGLLLASSMGDAAGSDPFGIGLTFHVDFASSTLLALDIVSSPLAGGVALLPIPAIPGLAGGRLNFQALWYWPPGSGCVPSLLSLSASSGLVVQFQS